MKKARGASVSVSGGVARPIEPPADLVHQSAVKSGAFTILHYFDALPWLRTGSDWTAWRAFVAATYGLPLTDREYEVFRRCTGRKDPPRRKVDEAVAICGRRARKSAIAALCATYESVYRDIKPYLAPGEIGRAIVMAKDKDESGQIHRFASAILSSAAHSYVLEDDPNAEVITLTNKTEIRIKAVSIVGGRSRSVFFAAMDEVGFWPKKGSAASDEDIYVGIKHAMANIPNPLRLLMSSAHTQRGLLWQRFDESYKLESDELLVWKAHTLVMHDNPVIRLFVKKEYEKDPINAAAEIGTEFRKDIEDYVPMEILRAARIAKRYELEPEPIIRGRPQIQYFAFVDTSGGVSDPMTLGIAHWDKKGELAVLDKITQIQPDPETGVFSPKRAARDLARVAKRYRCEYVTGDRYAGEWPRERFREAGLMYRISKATKTTIFKDFLPVLTSGQCELLDHAATLNQFHTLERREAPSGEVTIEARKGAQDDLANSVAGALRLAYQYGKNMAERQEEERPESTAELVEAEYKKAEDEAVAEAREQRQYTSEWTSWEE